MVCSLWNVEKWQRFTSLDQNSKNPNSKILKSKFKGVPGTFRPPECRRWIRNPILAGNGFDSPPGNTSRVLRGRLSPLPGIDISSWKEKYKLYYTLEWRHHQYDLISILAIFWKDPFCMIDLRYHQSWKSQNAFKIHEFSRTTNVTNAKPSTLTWPLDDQNIQFPTVSSKYNSLVILAHRIFIPVEFGPKWWRQIKLCLYMMEYIYMRLSP